MRKCRWMWYTNYILPWRIPWKRSPAGYRPWGRRVGHAWVTNHTHTHTYGIFLGLLTLSHCGVTHIHPESIQDPLKYQTVRWVKRLGDSEWGRLRQKDEHMESGVTEEERKDRRGTCVLFLAWSVSWSEKTLLNPSMYFHLTFVLT